MHGRVCGRVAGAAGRGTGDGGAGKRRTGGDATREAAFIVQKQAGESLRRVRRGPGKAGGGRGHPEREGKATSGRDQPTTARQGLAGCVSLRQREERIQRAHLTRRSQAGRAGQEGAAQSARPPLGVNSSICLADVSISILLPKPGHSPAPPYPSPTPRSCARCCCCSSSARAHARQAGAVRDRICIPRRERHVRSIDAARAGGRAGACASMFGRAQGRSFFIPVPAQGGRGGGASVSIIAVRTCHGDGGTTACHQERENTRRGGRPCAVGRRLAGMSPPCAVRWEHRAPTDDRRRYHVKVRDEISSRAPDRDAGGTRHDRARCFAASPAARELEATCPL